MKKVKITAAEQDIMEVIWRKQKAYMKDILASYDDPKPAATTIATVLKRLQTKKMIAYQQKGNAREYFPLVKKSAYFISEIQRLTTKFFDNSVAQFASYFTTNAKLNRKQLEELRDMIDKEIEKKTENG